MGADSQQPYIYEPTLQHKNRIAYPFSDFNPRAYSQASYAALQAKKDRPSRPKSDGPLINFNAHPDSYMVVTGQNLKYEPMPANTKKVVKWVRWVQLALRIHQELGSLGVLVLVICLKGMETSLSWIFRLSPAWDAFITLYAIYHLVRAAKARTPASSASYHFFALFMDTGLIPFYIFIAVFANQNYNLPPKSKERWTSYFPDTYADTLILLVTFAASAGLAGLHVISACLDVWLVVLFRKISKLPPDMNPLEDNLTARPIRASKHKYKNSDATMTPSIHEKDPKYLSGSALSVDRTSRLSTAKSPVPEVPDPRQVPFRHSRMDSDATFSPHNPETARWSRQQFADAGPYQQSPSARNSRQDIPHYSRAGSTTPSKHATFVESTMKVSQLSADRYITNSPRPASHSSSGRVQRSPYGDEKSARYSTTAVPNAAPTNAHVKSQQKEALLNDNWYVLEDGDGFASDMPSPLSARKQPKHHGSSQTHPLKMNPPTPLHEEFPDPDDVPDHGTVKRSALTERRDKGNGITDRTFTIESTVADGSSIYSGSEPSLNTRIGRDKIYGMHKGKYYGDLAAATMGIRGKTSNHSLNASNTSLDATGMAGTYGYGASPPPDKMSAGGRPKRDGKGRVVSRTGVDITDAAEMYPHDISGGFGMRERRDVSGKIAEEGRGGGWAPSSRW